MAISFGAGQRLFFVGLLIAVSLAFVWMVHDFLFPVFWAIVFALLLHPAYILLNKRVRNETLSTLIVMLAALILVVAPVAWLGTQIAQEALAFYRSVDQENLLASFEMPAPIAQALDSFGVDLESLEENFASLVQSASSWIVSEALAISSATFSFALKTILMFYLLFFFVRDGERIGAYVMKRLPLGDRKEKALFDRFAATTRAMMKGTVLAAVVQGIVGGIIFAIAGVENATLWGAVMALFAIIPAVGPGLVWLPAGLFLLGTGSLVPALIILIGGVALISTLDNILRPMLAGREVRMPEAVILVSILGGITAFGIAGVIAGPVIAALVLTAWDIFAKEYETQLTAQG